MIINKIIENNIEYTVKVFNNGNKLWHLNGQLHREDGPAVECADGTKYWHLNDQNINVKSQKEFEKFKKLKGFW